MRCRGSSRSKLRRRIARKLPPLLAPVLCLWRRRRSRRWTWTWGSSATRYSPFSRASSSTGEGRARCLARRRGRRRQLLLPPQREAPPPFPCIRTPLRRSPRIPQQLRLLAMAEPCSQEQNTRTRTNIRTRIRTREQEQLHWFYKFHTFLLKTSLQTFVHI